MRYFAGLAVVGLMGYLLGVAPFIEIPKEYGIALTEKPWDPMACYVISRDIAVAKFLKGLGARKSKVMAEYAKRGSGDEHGEFLREVSDAWDNDTDPSAWANDCVEKAAKAARRPGMGS